MHVHGAPALVDAREPGVVVKDSCSNRRSCTVSLRRDSLLAKHHCGQGRTRDSRRNTRQSEKHLVSRKRQNLSPNTRNTWR